ncbi:MAG: FAD:protein FMN transferase [Bacteroidota bacterium]
MSGCWAGLDAQVRLRADLRLMGSDFALTAVATDSSTASAAIAAGIQEIQRIEGRISSWAEDSETSAINRAAGTSPTPVSTELFQLINRASKVSALTEGAFDLTFGPLMRCWPLRDSSFQWPDSALVRKVRKLVGYQQIELDREASTVFLPQQGMQIGFGAIGKGYAANRARTIMQAFGLQGGMVNAGGDLTCWGDDLNQTGWTIGISDPGNTERIHTRLQINNLAVVTSGDYINYILHNGIRYSHILDPRTGYPVVNMSSVTVICSDAELADALATGVSVMGATEGINLLEQLREIEGIILTGDGQILQTSGVKRMRASKD